MRLWLSLRIHSLGCRLLELADKIGVSNDSDYPCEGCGGKAGI